VTTTARSEGTPISQTFLKFLWECSTNVVQFSQHRQETSHRASQVAGTAMGHPNAWHFDHPKAESMQTDTSLPRFAPTDFLKVLPHCRASILLLPTQAQGKHHIAPRARGETCLCSPQPSSRTVREPALLFPSTKPKALASQKQVQYQRGCDDSAVLCWGQGYALPLCHCPCQPAQRSLWEALPCL